MKRTGAVIAGLLIAFIGQFVAFAMTGAGHGWITPFFVSPFLGFAYPFVLVRAVNVFSAGKASLRLEWIAVAVAVASDALLAWLTYREGIEYFQRLLGGFAELWISIWIGWQGVAVMNLARAYGYLRGTIGYADPFEEDA